MNDLLAAAMTIPIVGAVSLLIYLGIAFRRKGPPERKRGIAEFLLIASVVEFVYVTQFMEFGNGLGDVLNAEPLRPVYIAVKYGVANAGGLTQVALNVLITIPCGALVMIVFPRGFRTIFRVFLAGLALSVVTEILQLTEGRTADIDDVIANSAGAAIGAALVILFRYTRSRIRRLQDSTRPGRWMVAAAITTILCVSAPFLMAILIDGGNRPGVVYYGHLRPTKVNTASSVASRGGSAILYHVSSDAGRKGELERLRGKLGIRGGCRKDVDHLECPATNGALLLVFHHDTWDIDFDRTATANVDRSRLPDEATGLRLVYAYLSDYGIDANALIYEGINTHFQDGLKLVFSSREVEVEGRIWWGKVAVTLGEKGRLINLEDSRMPFKAVRAVPVMSPRDAIRVAQDVGVGTIPRTASVEAVSAGHYFDETSGYLVPTWNVKGTYPNGDGPEMDWDPVIDARRS